MASSNGRDGNAAKEKPKFQFRGVWTPPEIMQKLVDKELTRGEYLLVQVIDALVTPRGEGCWATNTYLARTTGMSVMHVSACLQKLKREGLVIIYWQARGDNPEWRFLETTWSRAVKGVKKSRGGIKKNLDPPLKKNLYQNSSSSKKILNKKDAGVSASVGTNGFAFTESQESPWSAKWARRVHKELSKAHLLKKRPHLGKWAREIDLLEQSLVKERDMSRGDARARIEEVFDDHLSHLDDDWQPNLYSAATMCIEFGRLEKAIKRRQSPPGKDPLTERRRRQYEYDKKYVI